MIQESDPYLQDNGVLRSCLHDHEGGPIRNGYELRESEALFTQIRIAQLLDAPIAGQFNLKHLQAIHRHLFQDVYKWAGELRVVDIAKDIEFIEHQKLRSAFASIERLIGAVDRKVSRDEIPDRFAEILIALNFWHGFREGNGRANRMFLRQLANSHNLDIQFENMGRTELNGAHVLANAGFTGQIKSLFRRETRDNKTLNLTTFATPKPYGVAA